jgi:hypothetical protein
MCVRAPVCCTILAEAIGAGLGVLVRTLTLDEADAHVDWMAHFVIIDDATSSAFTRASLGWSPREVDLLTDLRDNGYVP